ncbi:hypothetical protein QTP70_015342 [Hemibagrus guttatus]|uniref:Uncharacterized protein n=1 Tax=Hemibagrus guttatus TaxID=175788 RepID=A0AAE0PUG3_9TELE|nr:hypothetical protein QTP70_015342 [Hemibagrus guttatus]
MPIYPRRSCTHKEGIKAGYTLDGVPTHRRAHTLSFTHYGQFRDANQPTMHVFGPGTRRKPPRHGENMQTPHTHGGGGNRTPWRCEANVLTTKPPSHRAP